MGERPVVLEGRNLALLVLLVVSWLAVLLLFAGPGRTATATARDVVASRHARLAEWEQRFGEARPLSAEERAAWGDLHAQLARFGAPDADELGLTSWVAAELRAPSVQGLEVVRQTDRDTGVEIEVRAPEGDLRTRLRSVSVAVRFESDYEDLARLLGRIESADSALSVRRIEATRRGQRVGVAIDLDLWVRSEVAS